MGPHDSPIIRIALLVHDGHVHVCLLDACDAHILEKPLSVHVSNGKPTFVRYRKGRLHRHLVQAPADHIVIHRDGDPLNNMRANLLLQSPAEAPHKFVSWVPSRNRWRARFMQGRHRVQRYFCLLSMAIAFVKDNTSTS